MAENPPQVVTEGNNNEKPSGRTSNTSRQGRGRESTAGNKGRNRAAIEEAKAAIADSNKKMVRVQNENTQIDQEDEKAKKEIQFHSHLQDELLRQYRIAQQELMDLETILANKQRDIEETKESTEAEIRVYQRKVKHLMASNQNEFASTYFTGEEQLFQERQEQLLTLTDPEKTVELLRSDENDLLLQNETLITNLRTEQDRVFSSLREEFEQKVEASRSMHEQRVKSMRSQLEEQRIRETEELKSRKDEQIKQLREKHKQAFEHIKRFFSGVTHNNLEVIKGSKAKIAKKKAEINSIRKDVDEKFAQRRKLEEPLKQIKEENEKLHKDIDVYKKDKRDLALNKAKIKELEEKKRNLLLAQEVLEQRFEQLEKERDALYDQFETSIHDVRQKTEFRAYILEQKVRKMHEELERKEMQLQQVMQRKGLDATAISAKIDDVMAVKNAKINQLEVELAKVNRAFNDIYKAFEAIMLKYGIPKDELGFTAKPETVPFSETPKSSLE